MENELSNNFGHMPVLDKHIVCTNIDNYGKVEYLRAKDVCACMNKLKEIFCRCTPKNECFYCYKIGLKVGKDLMEFNKNLEGGDDYGTNKHTTTTTKTTKTNKN